MESIPSTSTSSRRISSPPPSPLSSSTTSFVSHVYDLDDFKEEPFDDSDKSSEFSNGNDYTNLDWDYLHNDDGGGDGDAEEEEDVVIVEDPTRDNNSVNANGTNQEASTSLSHFPIDDTDLDLDSSGVGCGGTGESLGIGGSNFNYLLRFGFNDVPILEEQDIVVKDDGVEKKQNTDHHSEYNVQHLSIKNPTDPKDALALTKKKYNLRSSVKNEQEPSKSSNTQSQQHPTKKESTTNNHCQIQQLNENEIKLQDKEKIMELIDDKCTSTVQDEVTKKYKCSECPKQCTKRHYLKEHYYYAHFDLKPFVCRVCGKCFSLRRSLNKHVKVHSEIFKCKNCGKQFGTPSDLARHEQIHSTNRTWFTCNICGQTLSEAHKLRRHILVRHGNARSSSTNGSMEASTSLKNGADDGGGGFTLENTKNEASEELRRSILVVAHKCSKCDLLFEEKPKFDSHTCRGLKAQYGRNKRYESSASTTRLNMKTTFLCKICGRSFNSSVGVKFHERTHSAGTGVVGEFRGHKSESSSQRPQQHGSMSKSSLNVLDEPKSIFKRVDDDMNAEDPKKEPLPKNSRLLANKLLVHGADVKDNNKCDTCGKILSAKHGLVRHHKYVHCATATERKLRCTCKLCGKVLSRPDKIKDHQKRIHGSSKVEKFNGVDGGGRAAGAGGAIGPPIKLITTTYSGSNCKKNKVEVHKKVRQAEC